MGGGLELEAWLQSNVVSFCICTTLIKKHRQQKKIMSTQQDTVHARSHILVNESLSIVSEQTGAKCLDHTRAGRTSCEGRAAQCLVKYKESCKMGWRRENGTRVFRKDLLQAPFAASCNVCFKKLYLFVRTR